MTTANHSEEDLYTAEHCIWLIDVVSHLVNSATMDSIFGSGFTLDESRVHEYMDDCYNSEIIEHFIEVINKFGKPMNPEKY